MRRSKAASKISESSSIGPLPETLLRCGRKLVKVQFDPFDVTASNGRHDSSAGARSS